MQNKAQKLKFTPFGPGSPLHQLPVTNQALYLRRYLEELDAAIVLEEPNYFDRDYLAEFTAFYSRSSAGYPNLCRRLHFFKSPGLTRSQLRSAAGGNKAMQKQVSEKYLGFTVIRPIPCSPFGRTVLRWYPDRDPSTPRVVEAARDYHVHLAGICLTVNGLAWQQQDTGVGACATVGLWSMFHSSAFDDHHAIPTTVEITESAHQSGSPGVRVFPSSGLRPEQICEAVKGQKLAPMLFKGDIPYESTRDGKPRLGFSRERFASYCAAFLRSGYPILVIGQLNDDLNSGHAVCAVGFRSCAPGTVHSGDFGMQDRDIPRIYVHDDNLGPNVRFDIETDNSAFGVSAPPDQSPVFLRATHPDYVSTPGPDDPVSSHPLLKPWLLLVGTHDDVRVSAATLYDLAREIAEALANLVDVFYKQTTGKSGPGLTVSARYIKLSEFVGSELERQFQGDSKRLARTRLAITERLPPMSLHLGLVRIGLDDAAPLIDILFDTTDSERNSPVFGYIYYDSDMKVVMDALAKHANWNPGVSVDGC